ncbi:MAG: FecR domain-containing protein [Chitinophagaceae bacterium]
MVNKSLSYYMTRYAEGNLSEEERILLTEMLRAPAHQEELAALLESDWPFWESLGLELPERYAQVKKNVFEQIRMEEVEAAPEPEVRRIPLYRRWWAAASIILVLAAGAYYLASDKKIAEPVVAELTLSLIPPGKEGAVLTLADGSQVLLDTITTGTVALQNGVTAKVVDGTLVYEGKGNAVVYNTMSTPKGRQFQLTLPDGTKVWLNAASSIRYPTAFSGNERRVGITGEAYFEVTKNTTPFVVDADGRAEVTVLGTHFNINSYSNEAHLYATLLEGSVRITKGKESKLLQPGEQARVSGGVQVVSGANIEQVVAWKNGLFDFDGASLEEVMRQLERWYDIDVVYKGKVPNITFWGGITKDVPLGDLLTGLKRSEVNFRIEGRQLIVLP